MAKFTKQEVSYSKGMPQSHCGICKHFEPPHACEVVQGKIDPSYWCKKFTKKPGANAKGGSWTSR